MDAATAFLNACESGKGWEGVKDMVSPEASFACQATDALRALVAHTEIPCVTTLKGIGLLEPTCPQNLGMLGMHGLEAANKAVQMSDLLFPNPRNC